MGNIFNSDFQEFLRAMNENEAEYILVGGYSVILHGFPRTTGDMDIWVNRNKENYQKIVNAFRQFKMPLFEMTESNFLNHPEWDVFRFGRNPMAIDIMVRLKGLEFDEAFKRSEIMNVDGVSVRIIHYNDLISAKKASGRNKDIDDINSLESNRNE